MIIISCIIGGIIGWTIGQLLLCKPKKVYKSHKTEYRLNGFPLDRFESAHLENLDKYLEKDKKGK